jgi:hypothetical protein
MEPPRRQVRQDKLDKKQAGFFIKHPWRTWRLGGSKILAAVAVHRRISSSRIFNHHA